MAVYCVKPPVALAVLGTPTRLLSLPPLAVMLARARSATGSLRVKVMVAVSPLVSLVLSLVMAMVGGTVSMVLVDKVTVLLTSAPSAFWLPVASLNLALATEMTPLAVLLTAGVKVAVKTLPEPLKLVSVPPLKAMSARVKSVLASLRVKVMVALWPVSSCALSLVMAMVGPLVSALVVS